MLCGHGIHGRTLAWHARQHVRHMLLTDATKRLMLPKQLTRRTQVVAGHATPLAPRMPNPSGKFHFCIFMASIQHVPILFHRVSRRS
jgi:hypothetical protein